MIRSLFGKKPSPEEIEREVTEQLESLVRSGNNPPPPGWTLIGGLGGEQDADDSGAPSQAPAEGRAAVTDEAPAADEVQADEVDEEGPEAAEPVPAGRPRSRTRSSAKGATGTRSGSTRARSTRASGGSTATASRRSRS